MRSNDFSGHEFQASTNLHPPTVKLLEVELLMWEMEKESEKMTAILMAEEMAHLTRLAAESVLIPQEVWAAMADMPPRTAIQVQLEGLGFSSGLEPHQGTAQTLECGSCAVQCVC